MSFKRWLKQLCPNTWFIIDCCGITCCICTWVVVLYAEIMVSVVILEAVNFYSLCNWIISTSLTVLALTSHFKAMTTDPGAIPQNNATQDKINNLSLQPGEVLYQCYKCCSIKPKRAHHCSVCKRCIRKMDHHCPWINNCVGEFNQKYFVLFTFYVALQSLHTVFLTMMRAVSGCKGVIDKECVRISEPVTGILTLLLVFLAICFFSFTLTMFLTQIYSICSNESTIDRLKKESYTRKGTNKWMNFKSVFGNKYSLQWFSPFSGPKIVKENFYQHIV